MDVTARESTDTVIAILCTLGVPDAAARTQADVLVDAELRGHPSHGLLRVPRIAARIVNKVTSPTAQGKGIWVGESLLAVDGEDGLGPVVAMKAIDTLVGRAARSGVAAAAISRSNHLGSLAWYVEHIAMQGLVGIGLSTSEALVHPWGGSRAMVGSNPIAIGVPAEPHPLVFDMATAEVSMGKIIDHANRGESIPEGWAVDEAGSSTTDPVAALGGALSPFGGPKGYGLGIAIEALVASMSGSSLGRDVRGTLDSDQPSTKGDFFLVMRQPDPGTSLAALSAYLEDVRRSPAAEPGTAVRVPGDRAAGRREIADAALISLPSALWEELLSLREGVRPSGSSVPTIEGRCR